MADDVADLDAFDLLAQQTRAAILRALAERVRGPDGPSMSFTELRETVGARDAGNFTYHLEKLTDRFVAETDDGYRLTSTGIHLTARLAAGTYDESDRLAPVEFGADCRHCGDPLSVAYRDSLVSVACPNDHTLVAPFPPAAVAERTPSEVAHLLSRRAVRDVELALSGCCPACSSPVDCEPHDGDETGPGYELACTACGTFYRVPAGMTVVTHPAVVALYHDHGVDVRGRPLWALPFVAAEAVSVVATDPHRYRVTVEVDDEALEITLDERADVVGTGRA